MSSTASMYKAPSLPAGGRRASSPISAFQLPLLVVIPGISTLILVGMGVWWSVKECRRNVLDFSSSTIDPMIPYASGVVSRHVSSIETIALISALGALISWIILMAAMIAIAKVRGSVKNTSLTELFLMFGILVITGASSYGLYTMSNIWGDSQEAQRITTWSQQRYGVDLSEFNDSDVVSLLQQPADCHNHNCAQTIFNPGTGKHASSVISPQGMILVKIQPDRTMQELPKKTN